MLDRRTRPTSSPGSSMTLTLTSSKIATVILGLAAVVAFTAVAVNAQQSCHLRELDLCATSFLVLTQGPQGLATNEQEINKQCVHLREADTCISNYTRRCLTPMQRELLNFAANSSRQVLDDYCTKGTKFRLHYLKHAQCLNQVQKKERKGCIRDLQTSLETLTSSNPEFSSKRLQLACCTYRRFESCFEGHLEKRCGSDAVQFVNNVAHRITSRMPEIVCRSYRPESQECKALLPKPGTIPKGAKSSSVFSRLLSAYVGLN